MGLKAKFNLVMLVAFLVGLALAAGMSWRIVHENARREVLQEAAIMMAQASAIRNYTAKEIEPLLADQIKVRFLPHTVPSWAAQTNLRTMAKQFPDYTYKEAALNPTNPADRATDWESGIIAEFNRQPVTDGIHQHARRADRSDPVDLAADPHHRQGLPDLPFDARPRRRPR